MFVDEGELMKIWIKILTGIIIGALLGHFLPGGKATAETAAFISLLVIRIGRYVVFPLVFFALIVGTYELKREKRLFRVYGRTILYLVLSTALLTVVGVVSVLLFSPDRIPIIIESEVAFEITGFKESLFQVFPTNMFEVLTASGHVLLPVIFLAFILGINLDFEIRITNPVVQILDSLSRIFYHLNSLVVELFGIGLIAVTAGFFFTLRISDLTLFKELFIILAFDLILVIFGIYPGLLYLLGGKENPYKWLYAVIGPALTAFFTGDEYLAIGMLVRHGRESLGVPRRMGSAVYPLFAFFGRAGTAMVTGVSFILILRSYSSLEISFTQILWTLGFTFLTSLTLGSVPGMGSLVAISLLCTIFGKGIQEGYLILKPAAPLLISAGVILDVITSAFVAFLLSSHEGVRKEINVEDYL